MNGSRIGLPGSTDLLKLLGDPSRVRLMALLSEEELTVAELQRITGLAQSRVSTHLARLREARMVVDRPNGASTWYRIDEEGLPPTARALWELVQGATEDPVLESDRDRLDEVVAARNGGGSWAESVAGEMERHYSPGRTWEAAAFGLLGLGRLGDVLDLASGDGVLAGILSLRARSVTCVDQSARVCEAGRRRLKHLRNVRFHEGDMHALPLDDGSFDQAMLMNALTYSGDPARVFGELGRVLRPGGVLAGVTLNAHRHAEAVKRYGHVRLGFEPAELRGLLEDAGFSVDLCRVTSRERRRPHFEILTFHASRAGADPADPRPPRGTPPSMSPSLPPRT